MWSDSLTESEATYTLQVISELRSAAWASLLLRRIDERGGIIVANKPLLFEARFAYELHRRGVRSEYEHPAGVGDSTVEFKISTSKEWLIELVSVGESDGIRHATKTNGSFTTMSLSSSNARADTSRDEQKQSEEAEMITAQHKIGEKVLSRGQSTKFPRPTNAIHAILVDMRGYLGEGGDHIDYRQIAYGPDGVPRDQKHFVHCWQGKPIRGLFERLENHPAKAASLLQERIHMLGFIVEKDYRESEIASRAYWLPNPHLVSGSLEEDIKLTFPLQAK